MNHSHLTTSVRNWISDLIFPIRCLECKAFQAQNDPPYACRTCLKAVPLQTRFECIGCKSPTALGRTCLLCRSDWNIESLFVAADYRTPLVAGLIKATKYGFAKDASIPLSALIVSYIRQLASKKHIAVFNGDPIIIPVPMTRRRRNWRGFNQTEILAQSIQDKFHIGVAADVLIRVNMLRPQAEISSRQERLANTVSAFDVRSPETIRNRNILLVDDVCTTGATLEACAKTLRRAGADTVSALVVARDSWGDKN